MPEPSPGRDVDVRAIRNGGIAIACGIVFALTAAFFLLRARGPAASTPPHAFQAPAPLLQTAPEIERAGYFAEKERLTGSWAWVDRRAGIARIPVHQAMRVLAARAAQPQADAQPQAGSKPSGEAP